MKRLSQCLLLCGILLTGVSCRGFAVSLGGGWKNGGPWGGVSIVPVSPSTGKLTLSEAAEQYAILTQEDGSTGKLVIPSK